MTSEEEPRVVPVTIEEEMRSSYIDYAMSVIIGRAIPDARDGLKPVHRRTLYAMGEMGNSSDKPFRKSARVVGDVMGKYHPHGDAAIYDTLVKMAQPFTYRYMLVEGQGNFGSIDGDAPAAMRYTEVRLHPVAEALLEDINKETVDFTPNFDESLEEPVVLPAKTPNLLINGSSGIAVGYATNMPPHNIGEACRAVCTMIGNPEATVEELMKVLPGPDFPTGGIILGDTGIREAYHTGRGRMRVRGVAEIEDGKKNRIIITEIPYQVNKARLIEQIADLVKEKKIEGISDIRDESDRDGIRVVVELRKGTNAPVILNQLYKHTPLETTFGIINLSIVDRQPRVLGLKEMIGEFLTHRREVVRRRSLYDLRKAEERAHILQGLLLALSMIDEIVAAIRSSQTAEEALLKLTRDFGLDEVQADAILKMQLRRLAALEQKKIDDERADLEKQIARLQHILSEERHILEEIRKELEAIAERFGDPRRTIIAPDYEEIGREDLIERRDVLISLTHYNYIKHMPVETYRGQHRGGRGIIGMSTKEEDVVESVFVANTHDYLLCFTSNGRAYWLKVYNIPEGSRTSRGKAIVNLLNLGPDERVTAVIPVPEFRSDHYFFFSTAGGKVVKVPQDEFSRPRQSGINAINLREGEELVDVKATDGSFELILTTMNGQSLRFHEDQVRPLHRGSMGVRGIMLRKKDRLQNVTVVENDHLLTVTERGFGKRTSFDEFRGHGRGTMGVRNIRTDHTGGVVASRAVSDEDEIILMSSSGIVMRTAVSEISVQKRNTRGVRIMRMDEGDSVVGFAILPKADETD